MISQLTDRVIELLGIAGEDIDTSVSGVQLPPPEIADWRARDAVIRARSVLSIALRRLGRDYGSWPADARTAVDALHEAAFPDDTAHAVEFGWQMKLLRDRFGHVADRVEATLPFFEIGRDASDVEVLEAVAAALRGEEEWEARMKRQAQAVLDSIPDVAPDTGDEIAPADEAGYGPEALEVLQQMKPPRETTLSARVPTSVLTDLSNIAAACERSLDWLVVRAFKYYLGGEGEEVLSLLRAREQNARDGGHDADEVMRELDAIVNSAPEKASFYTEDGGWVKELRDGRRWRVGFDRDGNQIEIEELPRRKLEPKK